MNDEILNLLLVGGFAVLFGISALAFGLFWQRKQKQKQV